MKNRLFAAMGLATVAVLAIFVASLYAQTVAVGPYYAMPAWDQTLPCTTTENCPRFVVLSNFNAQAVLDRETGLVWQRSPSAQTESWSAAWIICPQRSTGGRQGWRLPSLEELESLYEGLPGQLPAGHPFENIGSLPTDRYWSSTRDPDVTNLAFNVTFVPGSGLAEFQTTAQFRYWCVRGGPGIRPSR